MTCIKCGNELPEGASFCTACGAPQPRQDKVDSAPPSGNGETRTDHYIHTPPFTPSATAAKPRKKGGFLKVLAVLILAIIALGGVTVLSYFTFLPAKYTLMIAEYSNVQKSFDAFDKNMTRYEERVIKPVYENTLQKETELGISVEDSLLEQFGIPSETISLIQSGLKTMKIRYGYALDAKGKKQTMSLSISPFVTLDMFVDNTKFGLSVPEFTNKTVVGNLKELDKLSEVFPELDPVLLEAYKDMDPWISNRIYEDIRIDRADIKKLMMDYSKSIIGSIKSKDMSIKRGQKTEVLGQDLSCQEVTITLDQDAQAQLLRDLLGKLEKDDLVYDLTAGNIIKLFEIMNQNAMFSQMLQGVDIEDILSKESYKFAIADLKEDLDPDFLPEEVIVKVYIKGLDVVKYEFDVSDPKVDTALVTIEKKIDGLSFEQLITVSAGANDEKADISLYMKKDHDTASDTTDLDVEFEFDLNMSDEQGKVLFTLESIEEPEGSSEVDHTVNATLKMDITSYGSPTRFENTVSMKGSKVRNAKGLTTSSEYKGSITLIAEDYLPQPVKVGFGTSTETTYGVKVNIPQPDEVLDIATATQEDYDELMNEFYEKLGPLVLMLYGF